MRKHTLAEAVAIKLVADQLTLLPLAEQRVRAARSFIDELVGRRTLVNIGDHNDFNALASPHYRVTGFGCSTGEQHRCIGRTHTSEAMVTVRIHLETNLFEVDIN